MNVVRIRPPGRDENNDPEAGTAARLTITGCSLEPKAAGDIGTRSGFTADAVLYAPYSADILHTDTIETPDGTFEVNGPVGRWANRFTGRKPGLTVSLRRAEG